MKVILYSTHCPRCIVLEKKLNEKSIEFDVCTDEDLMIEKGFSTAPMLEVDNQAMDFGAAVKWIGDQVIEEQDGCATCGL